MLWTRFFLVKFGTAYKAYLVFCKNDGKKDPEKKTDFKKVLP
jgi:hypothetical protein